LVGITYLAIMYDLDLNYTMKEIC